MFEFAGPERGEDSAKRTILYLLTDLPDGRTERHVSRLSWEGEWDPASEIFSPASALFTLAKSLLDGRCCIYEGMRGEGRVTARVLAFTYPKAIVTELKAVDSRRVELTRRRGCRLSQIRFLFSTDIVRCDPGAKRPIASIPNHVYPDKK